MTYPRAPRRPRSPRKVKALTGPAERYCAYCDQSFAALNCPDCERPLR